MNNDWQTSASTVMHSENQPVAGWTFLDESDRLIKLLNIYPGDRVLEIGCGSGKNFELIQRSLNGGGELTGVDSSAPMLRKASERVRNKGWKNVLLIDHEYGLEPVSQGRFDVVLLSFWFSTSPNWRWALDCAHAELRPGGRIGVVDFCGQESGLHEGPQLQTMSHISTNQSLEKRLQELFCESIHLHYNAWFGSLPYFIFVGDREVLSRQEVA